MIEFEDVSKVMVQMIIQQALRKYTKFKQWFSAAAGSNAGGIPNSDFYYGQKENLWDLRDIN